MKRLVVHPNLDRSPVDAAWRRWNPVTRTTRIGLLLVLAGCASPVTGDGSSDEGSDDAGSMVGTLSFAYSIGGFAGMFDATGTVSPTASEQTGRTTTWAAGYGTGIVTLNVEGIVARANQVYDQMRLSIGTQAVGTYPADGICVTDVPGCTGTSFLLGVAPSGGFDYSCSLQAATITLATISPQSPVLGSSPVRIASGSFQGSGICYRSGLPSTPITVSNGVFRVPIQGVPFAQ